MNDTTQPPSPSDPANGPTEPNLNSPPPPGSPPPRMGQCALDPIVCALRNGAEDARRAAQDAVPKLKSAAAKAAYHLAYGISFAGVFHYTLLRELCPETVKEGMRQGARAAATSAEKFADRLRKPWEAPSAPVPPVMEPTA